MSSEVLADAEKHRCIIDTGKYKLFVVVVKNQREAVEVCRKLVRDEGIYAVLLCPGFTHRDVAEIAETVGENVGVFVARGDSPSHRTSIETMKKEAGFQNRPSK